MDKKRIIPVSVVVVMLFLSGCAALGVREQKGPQAEAAKSDDASNAIDTGSPDSAGGSSEADEPYYNEFKIVTLLPKDAIPAVDNPQFLSAVEADNEYEPEEQVIGVNIDGEARAYSTSFLSSHEIVNDTVGGRKIAVTW